MVQVYLLSELFLFLASGLLLVDQMGTKILFLISLRSFYNKKSVYISTPIIGFVICLLLLLFPTSPGPAVIGDIVPAITILLLVIHFVRSIPSKTDSPIPQMQNPTLGTVTFFVALVHFLVPSIVLL